jgi:hypothetical protein
MFRSTRFIVIALAAAAFVPVAHASAPCGWVLGYDDQGVPWLSPSTTESCATAESDAQRSVASGATDRSPYPGWIRVVDDQGIPWLVPVADAAPSPDRVVAAKPASAPHAKKKGHASVPFITDNSPSQNRIAPRKVAATRMLAATLRAFPS